MSENCAELSAQQVVNAVCSTHFASLHFAFRSFHRSLVRSLEAELGEPEPNLDTIYQLEAGIKGWQEVIDYNDEIHANATLAANVVVDPGGEDAAIDGDKSNRISWSGGGQAYR